MMQYTDIMILLMKGSADVYINDDYQMHLQEFDNLKFVIKVCLGVITVKAIFCGFVMNILGIAYFY